MENDVMRRAQVRLDKLLAAMEHELIHAAEEELMQVVAELGLKPSMKGSVALFGVTRNVSWAKTLARGEKSAVDASRQSAGLPERASRKED